MDFLGTTTQIKDHAARHKPTFHRAFCDRGIMTEVMERIPLHVVTHPHTGVTRSLLDKSVMFSKAGFYKRKNSSPALTLNRDQFVFYLSNFSVPQFSVTTPTATPNDLFRQIESGRAPRIVDVRTAVAYCEGHLRDAGNIPTRSCSIASLRFGHCITNPSFSIHSGPRRRVAQEVWLHTHSVP